MPVPIKKKPKTEEPATPSIQNTPVVRLAVSHDGMPSKDKRYPVALGPQPSAPTVRLACSDGQGERNGSLDKHGPTVRLAHNEIGQGRNCLLGVNGVEQLPKESWPALLVSFFYLEGFLKRQKDYAYRDWAIDSGAFSAFNLGKPIILEEYMETCHRLKECDSSLVEIIALDVIGSGEGSLKNAYTMRENGLDVMPVFHIGEDWEILKEYCRVWDKVGLSCRFGEPIKTSMRFYEQCFARVWPKKCHSFGWQGEKMLMTFPFHSSDSADWEIKPCQFGTWRSFGRPGGTAYMNVRGSAQNLRCEVEWYLDLERRLRDRWKKEMALLGSIVPYGNLTTRLVVGTGRSVTDTGVSALNGPNVPRG